MAMSGHERAALERLLKIAKSHIGRSPRVAALSNAICLLGYLNESDRINGSDKAVPGARDSKVIVVCNKSSAEYYVSMVHRSGVSLLFDNWRSGQAPTSIAAGDCRSIMLGGDGMQIDAYLNVQTKRFLGGYKDVVFGSGDFSYRSETGDVRPANVVACVPTMETSFVNPDDRGRQTPLEGLV